MEKSLLYDMLESTLRDWMDKAEEDDDCEFAKTVNEAHDELSAELNENCKALLKRYTITVENKINYLYYNVNIKILNLGIKIGMDLQNAFAEFD